jgi:Kinesin-associated protein (KAP).
MLQAMNMLLDGPQDEMNLELVALCINLAINKRNAQIMVEENRLRRLMARAFRNQDSLIMKVIRNIAMHEGTKQNFVVSCIFHNMLLFKMCTWGSGCRLQGWDALILEMRASVWKEPPSSVISVEELHVAYLMLFH